MSTAPIPLLTIGGSDSGGAAGIQADLKTWAALRCYGMSAITVVTAQNSVTVAGAVWMSADFLATQITTVISDYQPLAIKTGMLGRVDLITAVVPHLAGKIAVIDPVLVNHRGDPLFDDAVIAAYREQLLPAATIITPNWREAALLAQQPITSVATLEAAARTLHTQGANAVLITGFPAKNSATGASQMHDLLCVDGELHRLPQPQIATQNVHGSGDTLSAALTASLAQGTPLLQAVSHAQQFTKRALQRSADWQLCAGHGPVGQGK